MTDKEEIAALLARVEELERKAKPPEPPKPFVPQPYQRYDPTAGMSMPPSALRAMVEAVPDQIMRGVMRDNRGAPTGPTTMVPSASRQGSGPANVPGSGTGWARETPLGPSPHQRYVDQQNAQDMRDRQELVEQKAREQALLKAAERTP